MSKQHILNWIVFIVLVGCISWLVAVDMGRSGASGGFSVKNGYSKPYVVQNSNYRLQPAKTIQKTQSASMLHKLSSGVEILPIEMLQSEYLSTPKQLINVCDNQYGYMVVSGCGYEVIK